MYRSRPRSPATTSAAIVLPVPGGPANSAAGSPAAGELGAEPPVLEHALAQAGSPADLPQLRDGLSGEHQVIPSVHGLDPPGQRGQLVPALPAGGREEARPLQVPGPGRRSAAGQPGRLRGDGRRLGDLVRPEAERCGQGVGVGRGDGAAMRGDGIQPGGPARGEVRRAEADLEHPQRLAARRAPGLVAGQDDNAGVLGQFPVERGPVSRRRGHVIGAAQAQDRLPQAGSGENPGKKPGPFGTTACLGGQPGEVSHQQRGP